MLRCSLCEREMEEEDVFVCKNKGKITGYECVDEKECKNIFTGLFQAKNEEENDEKNANFQKEYGFPVQELERVQYNSKFFRRKNHRNSFFELSWSDDRGYIECSADQCKELSNKYNLVLTKNDFQEKFGLTVDELDYLANEVIYRDGGNKIYHHDGSNTFFQKNNLSGRWSKIREDQYDHYYNKYRFLI